MTSTLPQFSVREHHGQRTVTREWPQMLTDIHPRYGGISTAVPELASALKEEAIASPVIALCDNGDHYVPHQLRPGSIHFLPKSRRQWVMSREPAMLLRDLLRAADGLHVHGLWTQATQAVRIAQRQGLPCCISAHGMLEPWSLRQNRLRKQVYAALVENRVLRGAACLHALTSSEAQSYRAITREVPIVTVPNGVTVPFFISAEKFWNAYPHLRDRRLVLFLGRLHPKKGVDILLRAWRDVCKQHPEAHLVIAGAGDIAYERTLRSLAAEHLQDRVTFAGLLQGDLKWSALKAAECFILPSHSEGLSVAILEALGSGTPVIGTPQCNMPELVHSRCGWLTAAADDAVSASLQELFERTPAENRAAGERGRSLVRQRYTWTAVARQMAEVYRWLNGASLPASVEVLV